LSLKESSVPKKKSSETIGLLALALYIKHAEVEFLRVGNRTRVRQRV